MAYYRVDVLSIEELGRIFTKLAGWSTGKAAGHSMMAWATKKQKQQGPVTRTAIDRLH